jgi:hypothetical protein
LGRTSQAAAQHPHATDRFACEIAAIFEIQLALAAADAQTVSPLQLSANVSLFGNNRIGSEGISLLVLDMKEQK